MFGDSATARPNEAPIVFVKSIAIKEKQTVGLPQIEPVKTKTQDGRLLLEPSHGPVPSLLL
jgi:hypothetical protein